MKAKKTGGDGGDRNFQLLLRDGIRTLNTIWQRTGLKLVPGTTYIKADDILSKQGITGTLISHLRANNILPPQFKSSRTRYFVAVLQSAGRGSPLRSFSSVEFFGAGGILTAQGIPGPWQKNPHLALCLVHCRGKISGNAAANSRGAVIHPTELTLANDEEHRLTPEQYNALVELAQGKYPHIPIEASLGTDPDTN